MRFGHVNVNAAIQRELDKERADEVDAHLMTTAEKYEKVFGGNPSPFRETFTYYRGTPVEPVRGTQGVPTITREDES